MKYSHIWAWGNILYLLKTILIATFRMNNAPVHCPDVCSRAISEHVIIEVVYILIHILINPYYISFYSQVAKCFFHTRWDRLTFPLPQPIVSLPAEHSKSGSAYSTGTGILSFSDFSCHHPSFFLMPLSFLIILFFFLFS